MKTIAFALPNSLEYINLKEKLKKGAINFAKKTPEIISSILSKYVSEDIGTFTDEGINVFKKEFNSKMELLDEIDKDTLYFDGFEDIKKEVQTIYSKNNNNFKIIVFIDDLDRCSPNKTLEVFESIKVFLGIECFIYILGISHGIVSKLIDIEFKKSGIKGEEYIKKMIQIPITLPAWNNDSISQLINHLLENGVIDSTYEKIIRNNIDIIPIAIEPNPREIKRFLNSLFVALLIFSTETINQKELDRHERGLLIIKALELRWPTFYGEFKKSNKHFREELIKYARLDGELA